MQNQSKEDVDFTHVNKEGYIFFYNINTTFSGQQ